MTVAISLQGISKCFYLGFNRPSFVRLLVKRLLGRRSEVREHWALRDIDFEILKGEAVGIIGANGSGKSTLLSLVVGTVHPTAGTVTAHGRIGSLLELGAGFHPDLTGFENIFLNASLLGLSRAEVEENIDSIIEFAQKNVSNFTP